MEASSTSPIIIIGAGLGGLALAHGLLGAGVPFHVYERDPSPEFRPQGYRVRISPEGAEALHSVLPTELWAEFEKRCAVAPQGMSTIDAVTGKPHETTHKPMIHRQQKANFGSYTADRNETRDLLLQGLDGHITFGKELDTSKISADCVIVYFTDGTEAHGSMLVGADGVRSKVRQQHFVAQAPVDTQARAIYGKTPLTTELEGLLTPDMLSKACLVQDRSGNRRVGVVTLFAEAIRFPENDLPHPSDYYYWVLIADRAAFNEEGDMHDNVAHLPDQEARDVSLRVVSRWDRSVAALLEHQEASQTSGLRICSSVPAKLNWQSHPHVTVLGDAIHVAPPAGGQGANLAIKDAWVLTEALKIHGVGEKAIDAYESQMRDYAASAVQASLGGGKWMFDQLDYELCDVVEF